MSWKELPVKLKIFISLITLASIPLLFWAFWNVLNFPHPNDPDGINWLILVVLTLLTVPFFHLLPSNTIIGIGDSYIMAVAMLYGPAPCIIATLCHTLFASIFVPNRPKAYRVIFNTSSMICGAWLYAGIYRLLNPELIPDPPLILLPAVLLTLTFFLFNSIVTSTAISWSTNDNTSQFWLKNCLPLSIDFSVSAVAAVIIVIFGKAPIVPLAVAPLVGVIWGFNNLNKAKALDAVKHLKEQELLYLRTVETLALAVDAKDQSTYGHIRRVKAYAMGLAKYCGLTDPNELKAIETGSLLHDIGKLAIEDYILNKPGRLSSQEFEKMKIHATAGDEILQQVQFPYPVATCVRYHHERWDGKGYPDGLKETQIPLSARILSIADAYDAIRSSRPYKSAFGVDDSVELLRAQAGISYDPHLVDIFISNIRQLEADADEATKNISELSFRKYFDKIDASPSTDLQTVSNPILHSSGFEELVGIIEFCSGIARSLGLTDAIPIIARRIKNVVPYDTFILFRRHPDSSIIAEASYGLYSDFLLHTKIGLGKGISGWVAAYKRPMMNSNPALEFEGLSQDCNSLKDVLSIPLLLDENSIGVISLYSTSERFYTATHASHLQTISEEIAPLLNNATSPSAMNKSAFLDPVTQTYSFAYLAIAGQQILEQTQNSPAPISLIYFGIQNFSQIVSLFGNPIGDSVLLKFATILSSELRQTDVLSRFGHHAFVALLPGVRGSQAERFVQRLQQRIKATPLLASYGNKTYANIQAGIASYPDEGSSVLSLLKVAQNDFAKHSAPIPVEAEFLDRNIVEFPPRT